jgi:hypothetical protein
LQTAQAIQELQMLLMQLLSEHRGIEHLKNCDWMVINGDYMAISGD